MCKLPCRIAPVILCIVLFWASTAGAAQGSDLGLVDLDLNSDNGFSVSVEQPLVLAWELGPDAGVDTWWILELIGDLHIGSEGQGQVLLSASVNGLTSLQFEVEVDQDEVRYSAVGLVQEVNEQVNGRPESLQVSFSNYLRSASLTPGPAELVISVSLSGDVADVVFDVADLSRLVSTDVNPSPVVLRIGDASEEVHETHIKVTVPYMIRADLTRTNGQGSVEVFASPPAIAIEPTMVDFDAVNGEWEGAIEMSVDRDSAHQVTVVVESADANSPTAQFVIPADGLGLDVESGSWFRTAYGVLGAVLVALALTVLLRVSRINLIRRFKR